MFLSIIFSSETSWCHLGVLAREWAISSSRALSPRSWECLEAAIRNSLMLAIGHIMNEAISSLQKFQCHQCRLHSLSQHAPKSTAGTKTLIYEHKKRIIGGKLGSATDGPAGCSRTAVWLRRENFAFKSSTSRPNCKLTVSRLLFSACSIAIAFSAFSTASKEHSWNLLSNNSKQQIIYRLRWDVLPCCSYRLINFCVAQSRIVETYFSDYLPKYCTWKE